MREPAFTARFDAADNSPRLTSTYGDFDEVSPWFANQPEFQRMREGEQAEASRKGRRRFGRWLALIAVAGLGYWVWSSELVTYADIEGGASRIDLEQIKAAISLDALKVPGSDARVEPDPASPGEAEPAREPSATASSANGQGAAASKSKISRVSTALGPVLSQTGDTTVLARTNRDAKPVTSAFTGASAAAGSALSEPFANVSGNADQQ